MVDDRWKDKRLTRGQVTQRLKSLGCFEVKQHAENTSIWETSTGKTFSMSYDDIEAADLEGIVTQVHKWIEESGTKK